MRPDEFQRRSGRQRICKHWCLLLLRRRADDARRYWRGVYLFSLQHSATSNSAKFIVGNTFPMVVFYSFGAFWATFGATLMPFFSAYGNYVAEDPTPVNPTGLNAPQFNNAFGKSADPSSLALEEQSLIESRLLPPLHGSPLLRLPDLRPSDQFDVRHDLFHPGPSFRPAHSCLLVYRIRRSG